MRVERHTSGDPEQTRRIAAALLPRLGPRAILALHGELGAGKTCFVQGLALALGVDQPVTSPTFALAAEYRGRQPLHHLDLYRLRDARDAFSLGIEDYLRGEGITAIEWAERIAALLPADVIHVRFAHGSSDRERLIEVQWPECGPAGADA
jgi:tRNA threonylcarbamoyladenosine biosynthesis protein TsaE